MDAQNSGGAVVVREPIYRRWWFWVLTTPVILFIAIVIYRIPAVMEQDRTAEAVAQIHAQKLTIEDVNGEHLPPPPDPALVDATVEGVDANANGIRDDVELAIFKKYPNSQRIRAAELQYAKALQMYLTKVFNSETWLAVQTQDARGYACISEMFPRDTLKYHLQMTDVHTIEVENLVFNTQPRKDAKESAFIFTTSFSLPSENFCDVHLK